MMKQGFSPKTNQNRAFDDDPNVKQRQASNPLDTVWVGASAGTGKTKILTDRVLRLMLPKIGMGIETATSPEKILCITFTKAAAAEMALRINSTLSEWAVISDEELSKKLKDLTGYEADEQMKNVARRLFAHVVDTAGGMKIMTIHSFCQSVLRRFPIEAKLSPHFEVMDERTAQDYLTRCQSDMIHTLKETTDKELSQAFEHLTYLLNADQMEGLLQELTKNRSRLSYLLNYEGGYDAVVQKIYTQLDCSREQTSEELIKQVINNNKFNSVELQQACDALSCGSKTDVKTNDIMHDFLACTDINKKIALFAKYKYAFLTKGDHSIRKKLATQQAQKHMPNILDVLARQAETVLDLHSKIQSLNVAKVTSEVLKIGSYILELYTKYKQQYALLDYDDLIFYTRDLLKEHSSAAWVLYKLDGGIDHVLVDEAQDTNPEQWQVISSLTEEFFSGHGSDDNLEKLRTLFVVGDEKQSIFSFNNADPVEFSRMQHHFANRVTSSQNEWKKIDLDVSFRSTPEILSFVDKVFEPDDTRSGVVVENETSILHYPFRKGQSGMVELWPVIAVPEQDIEQQELGWLLPTKIRQTESSGIILANKIADTIDNWIKNNELLIAKNRPIEPRDIMILVRTRNVFVTQCVRALKTRNIPVAGVDRMVLNKQLAIMDFITVAKFCLLPDDDLNLATLLKTPLIGLDENDLFALCYDRKGTVWESVQQHERYKNIAEYLTKCIKKSSSLSPYSFFAELLNQSCPNSIISGREAVLSRLGYDAIDPLEELLNSCFQYTQQNTASLQGFLQWFTQGKTQVKREQEQNDTNQVRIMTVHGSKGLQAPVVFMPDTTSHPKDNKAMQDKLLWEKQSDNNYYPLWSPRKDMDNLHYTKRKNNASRREDEEYKRLLYVAITRAEDRLYICGYKKKVDTKIYDKSWYSILHKAMLPMAEEIEFNVDGVSLQSDEENNLPPPALRLQFSNNEIIAEQQTEKHIAKTRHGNINPIPDWCYSLAPNDPTPAKPLVPSKPTNAEPATRSPLEQKDNEQRFQRGLLIHKLLEVIPTIHNKEQRTNAIKKFLARKVHKLTISEQENIHNEVMSVLEHEVFAPIFGKGSEAEVPFHGRLEQDNDKQSFFAVSGVIDRLLVTETDVYIIDYKTNRPPPTKEENIPEIYLKQMEMYKITLKSIYPDRSIHAALLWTDGPFLMPLS